MEWERFIAIIDSLVKSGRIDVTCPACSEVITKNYLSVFNAGSTRCNNCDKFYDNEEILYIPVSN